MPRRSRTKILKAQRTRNGPQFAPRQHVPQCCDKVTYPDAIRASYALSKIQRSVNRPAWGEMIPTRVRQCEHGGWHLGGGARPEHLRRSA